MSPPTLVPSRLPWSADLGSDGPWLLALAVALLVAACLRRSLARMPGARAAWSLPLALALAYVGSAEFRSGTTAESSALDTEAAAPPSWRPQLVPDGEGRLARESWNELQGLLGREGEPVSVAEAKLSGAGLALVPPHWSLPPGADLRLAFSPETAAASGDGAAASAAAETGGETGGAAEETSWCLEHPARGERGRSTALTLRRLGGSGTALLAEALVLEARRGGAEGWLRWAGLPRLLDADTARFEWIPESGDAWDLRVLAAGVEAARSRIEVLPSPLVSWRGARLESLRAALAAQGYELRASEALEGRAPDLVLLGEGARLADEEGAALREGAGLWVASPEAWTALQARADEAEWLPARIEALPEAGEPDGDPGGEAAAGGASETPPPEETPPRPEKTQSGRFALLVVLDLSGSFAEPLALAWGQLAAIFAQADAFDLQGVLGFNKEVFPLLPLGEHGADLERLLEAQRSKLDDYVERGGATTRFAPAMQRVASEWDRVKPDAMLVVVLSDGIFAERPNELWMRIVESELVGKRGIVLATIHIVAARTWPEAVQTGLLNLDQIASIGGTVKATRRSSLGAALRLVPLVAREVGAAAGWTPPGGEGGAGETEPAPEEGGEREEDPGVKEPEPALPLRPSATGWHPAEGLPGELDEGEWPPLAALHPVRLRSWAATAWTVEARRSPLLVTGAVGKGRIALAASETDGEAWPGASEDPRFPLWAARIADFLRRRPAPLPPLAWRSTEGLAGAVPARAQEAAERIQAELFASTTAPAWGSFRRDGAGGVQSTLRPGRPPRALQGERPWWEGLGGSQPSAPGVRAPEGVAEGGRRERLAALGALLGVLVFAEAAFALWARSRRGAH